MPTPDDAATAALLVRDVGPLRRALAKAARAAADLPDLPDAQIEVIRELAASGPQSPGDLAARLRLARSTVSNLVTTLVAAGLVERAAEPSDLRSVTLSASPVALDRMRRYDVLGAQVVERALESLPANDRAALAAAAPALAELTRQLE
ncbi:MarR family winged helix-turn-helix transcriptional regulator [Frondihabitans cladoniiphilus]|uniref:HTH marR-type domain-containing protein n=1 Tax=Frondihabitans cladoniiphilus TaxID=715785 RepID=A0ABP8W115_9MICO